MQLKTVSGPVGVASSTPAEPGARRVEVDVRGVSLVVPKATTGRRGEEPGELLVLDEIDLRIHAGEFVAIVGPSGCGKTSLLNIVAGLVEQTSGTVSVRDGRPADRHEIMSYMLARDALFPWRSALGNVEIALGTQGTKAERRDRSRAALANLGLGDFENALPRQLSHGMRQRVALARTLVRDPDLLLMDEPFGALDAQTRLAVHTDFLRTWEGSGRSVILVTHDLQEAILLADRVVVMSSRPGRIQSDQPVALHRPRAEDTSELFLSEGFRDLYHQLFENLKVAEAVRD